MVTDVDAKQGNVKVDFMHPHGPHKTFNWPQSGDTCYVPMKNILCMIYAPTASTGRSYKIADVDYQSTLSALLVWVCDIFHETTSLEKAKAWMFFYLLFFPLPFF